MYVWFDALTNYASGVYALDKKHPESKWWPADVHVIGKDIAWFHCVIWPAMLMSGGVPVPKSVWVHGFVAGPDGRKMSKSLGNVVNPHEALDQVPSDSLRWYLCREAAWGDDLKFGYQAMKLMHNADLCDGLGNLVNRAIKFAMMYSDAKVPAVKSVGPFPFETSAIIQDYQAHFDALGTKEAADVAQRACAATNKWLADLEPWKMKQAEEQPRRLEVLKVLLEAVYVLLHLYAPFIPTAAAAILRKFKAPAKSLGELKGFDNLPQGCEVSSESVLFQPFEVEVDTEKKEKPKAAPKAAAAGTLDQPLFSQLDIRVGKITSVRNHPEADRLYVEEIDIGDETRQIVSGLREHYTLEQMQDRRILVVCNMKPRPMMKVESAGMVLCAKSADGKTTVEFVDPPADAPVGARIVLPGQEGFKPAEPNYVGKKKVWEAVAPGLKTDAKRVVCFEGKPLVANAGKKGKVVAPTLANLQVS